MKNLKYFILILCVSFTSVIMLNAVFVSTISLSVENIKVIFGVCSLIALLCMIMGQLPIIKDYPMIYSFVIVMSIAIGTQYVFDPSVLTHSLIKYLAFLMGTYLVVWGCIYVDDYKDVQKLNKKLKNEH